MQILCEEYGSAITFDIDGKIYSSEDYPWQISTWSNRKHLTQTIDFRVIKNGETIFSFHDSPDELMADISQLGLLEKLHQMQIVRYKIHKHEKPKNLIQRIKEYMEERKKK